MGYQDASYGTDNVFDISDCNNECSQTKKEVDPWWIVDLQDAYKINTVKVHSCDDDTLSKYNICDRSQRKVPYVYF